MICLFADEALLPDGWADNVRVRIGDGRITSVERNQVRRSDDTTLTQKVLLPAPSNLHSHAFQRAFAGMTEARGSEGRDSFWTWRQLMYRFLDRLTPDHVQAIAAMVQVEMLEAGYASVGEFHYLHHDRDGARYDDPAEMSSRIMAAATETGIGLTHLPVLYERADAYNAPLSAAQRRFGHDIDGFAALIERIAPGMDTMPADWQLGVAPHSLRAVSPDALREAPALIPDGPVHIHIAEQPAEVAEIEQVTGSRAVAWLVDTHNVDHRWCLVHATHMNADETDRLAQTGAVAGLCPMTEANLGDGIFPAVQFLKAGGTFGIGSDSNVRISLTEELRLLEYGQRLQHFGRAVLADEMRSTGRFLFDHVCAGGVRALGRQSGAIQVGAWADMLTLDMTALPLANLVGDMLLDGWIFAGDDRIVRDVWSAGRHVVRDGQHTARDTVEARFRKTLSDLRSAL